MKRQRVSTPSNIRFEGKTIDRLEQQAVRFGLTKSELVRQAVIDKLPEWEKSNGIIIRARTT